MEIKKLNVKEFNEFTNDNIYLKDKDVYVIDPLNIADVQACLIDILQKRERKQNETYDQYAKSVNSALKDARIIAKDCNQSTMETDYIGNYYYVPYGVNSKQGLINECMKVYGFTDMSKYLTWLDNNVSCKGLSEITDKIF